MNTRITTSSLIIAAACGFGFSQMAYAQEAEQEEVRNTHANRFTFDANTYRLDKVSSRPHFIGVIPATPKSSVHSGTAPKNLLGIDPGFVSKPAPLPVAPPPAAPAPIQQVAAKQIIPSNNPFSSIFNKPTAPLVAQGAGALPPVSPPAAAHAGHLPATHANTGVHGTVLRQHHPTPVAAVAHRAPDASYGSMGYQPVAVIPTISSGGTNVDTGVRGVIIGQHKKH